MGRCFLLIGCFAALTGVALGAFGAHALRDILDSRQLDAWKTAVNYQLVHGIGLLGIGLLALREKRRAYGWAGGLLSLGIFLFSGSIYGLSAGWRWLWPVTPVGGFAFIFGWLVLLIALCRRAP